MSRAARWLAGVRERGRWPEPACALSFDDGPDPVYTPRLLEALQRTAHDLLGVPEPVDGGGVDPVDAQGEGLPDRRDRLPPA